MPEYQRSTFHRHGVRSFDAPGFLSDLGNTLKLAQAVVIPPGSSFVITSGQCGFRDDGSFPQSVEEQVMLAFANAEKTLKEAGVLDGWKSVYQMTTYTPNANDELEKAVMKAKDRYLGENRLAWTGISVPNLWGGAVLEMTLNAFIPPQAAEVTRR